VRTGTQSGDLPGMPPVLDRKDIYVGIRPGPLSPAVKDFPGPRLRAEQRRQHRRRDRPEDVQDHRPLRRRPEPQHVTPSFDLKSLWVLSDLGDSITHIDPATAARARH
jgi:hypothetical protein